MLEDEELYTVVHKDFGVGESWAVYHELQGVYLCTVDEREAKALADLLNQCDIICVVEED